MEITAGTRCIVLLFVLTTVGRGIAFTRGVKNTRRSASYAKPNYHRTHQITIQPASQSIGTPVMTTTDGLLQRPR